MIAILTGVRWNLSMGLTCISFIARDGENCLLCFLAIWISSFEKVHFSSVSHFFIGSLIWGGVWFFELPVYSSYQSFVWCTSSKEYSPHSIGGLFNLETISFVVQKVVSFVHPFFLLLGHLCSTEEVLAYTYCFQSIPCSFILLTAMFWVWY
jgi:hypothetical protein